MFLWINGERLNVSFCKSGMRQGCLISSLYILEVLASATKLLEEHIGEIFIILSLDTEITYFKRKTNTLDFNKIKLFLVKLPLGKNKRQGINWRKPNVVPISKNGLYPEYIENFYNSLVRRKTTHF